MLYSGARIIIETLIEQGADTIFGYPGSSVLNIYDEIYRQRKRIRHILVSHEQHAAHAADGYARSSGRPGICLATSGPGATNLITGIAAAYMDSIPLIAITGNVSTSLLGKDSFQEVDIAGISMPIVKHNWIVKDIGELASVIREAFIVTQEGRKGPVLIDIPMDISTAKTQWFPAKGESRIITEREKRLLGKYRKKTFTDHDIEKAASLIKLAKRPLIYAGGGLIGANAGKEILKLSQKLNAPIALSLMGIGAVPHNYPLFTGLIGMHGTAASNKAAQKADLIIALGARFSDRVLCGDNVFAKTAKIIHFDIDPAEINKNMEAHSWVIGDLKESLAALVKKVPSKSNGAWLKLIDGWKHAPAKGKKAEKAGKDALIPSFIIKEAAQKLGSETIAVSDVGQHQIWAAQYFPASGPRSFICSGGLGAMGFGMGAALGAKIASPKRPVLLFTGDGCFRMNSGELATLSSYKIPLLIIIFNNGVLGMVRQWQDNFYEGRYSESTLGREPDFIKLCDAYNIRAFRAKDRLSFSKALDMAYDELMQGRAALIEACIDPDLKVLPIVVSGGGKKGN